MTPPVVGDPEAMRVLARELGSRAELLSSIPAGFKASLDGSTFEGAAANRLRAAAASTHGRVAHLADDLRTVAANLFADARVVEQQNAAAAAQAAADAQTAG